MKTNILYVRFPNCSEYPYLNDKFDLAVGDKVYVDGKLAGVLGEVTEALTKFKVSLKYYKYVLQKVDFDIKGEYKKTDNFMNLKAINANEVKILIFNQKRMLKRLFISRFFLCFYMA